jgi:hypothetical protein
METKTQAAEAETFAQELLGKLRLNAWLSDAELKAVRQRFTTDEYARQAWIRTCLEVGSDAITLLAEEEDDQKLVDKFFSAVRVVQKLCCVMPAPYAALCAAELDSMMPLRLSKVVTPERLHRLRKILEDIQASTVS